GHTLSLKRVSDPSITVGSRRRVSWRRYDATESPVEQFVVHAGHERRSAEPYVPAQPHEEQRRDGLRYQFVAIKRRLNPAFVKVGNQPACRAEDPAQRSAGHQPGRDDHAALADEMAWL